MTPRPEPKTFDGRWRLSVDRGGVGDAWYYNVLIAELEAASAGF